MQNQPFPEIGKARKRLTSPLFLARNRQVLRAGGLVHLKTDSPLLYEYTLEQIAEHKLPVHEQSGNMYTDLVRRVPPKEQVVPNIRTRYEEMWLAEGRTIHYVRFGM
ncbi:MAG: hypothetical protein J5I62_08420 [Flavobacteriales bacterium]|nr:hypothetical protein [Flavobacteriales bacterium]MEB2340408.1 hypothetical protein [Flavobacteriia bacterium]